MAERRYSRQLNLHYSYDPREMVLIFDDGVKYTLNEALVLSRGGAKKNDLEAIHKVKAVFHGEIIDPRDCRERPCYVRRSYDKVRKPEIVQVLRPVSQKQREELPDSCQMRIEFQQEEK